MDEETIIARARLPKIGESGYYKNLPVQIDPNQTRNIPINHKKTSLAFKNLNKNTNNLNS